ncbi:hypothetical protein Gogos_009050 [Gossypium gossypioides]|uniref:CCHC-type domain-containing protein n=1 Tax=Gossypium gossypioides TaxID=34282 RepID=A0A7J9CDF7_GOSGO|nr:hypothetical protein [Gossypium gossypioides]
MTEKRKKVRFKEGDGDVDLEMVLDLDSQPKVSRKQMLLGKGVSDQAEGSRSIEVYCTDDFEFLEGDVKKTMVNGIPAIEQQNHGRYARMVIFVDLDKHLVSQVLVNGELLWVEYEALPTICFSCGKYGHLKEMYPSLAASKGNETRKISGNSELTESKIGGEGSAFGP